MRTRWTQTAFLATILAVGLAGCGGNEPAPLINVGADGTSTIDSGALPEVLATYPLSALSPAEVESLTFMREEEQLAHDVYTLSGTLWQQPIFNNIRDSEETHAAAVQTLLVRYNLPDPLAGIPTGIYPAPGLQAFFDRLIASSRLSLIDALKAGVEIEEHDIVDITAQKANIDNADILRVYDSLLLGSRNHLRAFMKVLTQQGGTYVPQYLSQSEFNAIVNSPIERGR